MNLGSDRGLPIPTVPTEKSLILPKSEFPHLLRGDLAMRVRNFKWKVHGSGPGTLDAQ